MVTTSEQLGAIIGNLINAQSSTNANISGESNKALITRRINEKFKLTGNITFTKKVHHG